MAEGPATPVDASTGARSISRIPVRNLWLLLLYASDLLRTNGNLRGTAEERINDLPDLLAEMLIARVQRRLARGLTPGYRTMTIDTSRVRGRIDLRRTETRALQSRGVVACRVDELTFDTPRHRLVMHALERLAPLVTNRESARRCRSLARSLRACGVSTSVPEAAWRRIESYGRHDADDRVMVDTAWLALDLCLPSEDAGLRQLDAPDREGAWVRRLFERAVGGFYYTVLDSQRWRVGRGDQFDWPRGRATHGIDRVFPARMTTDIVLDDRSALRRVVIDTKFNEILVAGWYRDESLRSGYVYQMYAYLRTQAGRGDPISDRAEGLLLHPAVGRHVDECIELHEHRLRFATVDLSGQASEIRTRLLQVIEPALGD